MPLIVLNETQLFRVGALFFQIKDGKVNAEALKAGILKDNGGNEKAAGPVNEVVADCQSLTNDKKCELAFQLMDCVLKSYAKRTPAPK